MKNQEAIKHFAQQVLGCQCPDEVFEQTECDPLSLGELDVIRILIGKRLLIYLARIDSQDSIRSQLPTILQAGRKERDHQGYNRFRAVIASDDETRLESLARIIFNRWSDRDEDIFLHLVDARHTVIFH